MSTPVRYLDNPIIAARIGCAPAFIKSAQTLLRAPAPAELGVGLSTYVQDIQSGGSVRLEATNTITSDKIIARNPGPPLGVINGGPVFNEWLIDRDIAVKNYGDEVVSALGHEFSPHAKQGSVRAIVLDETTMKELGAAGDTLEIAVDWSAEPMTAKIGDWLTSGGYSISSADFSATYERQGAVTSDKKTSVRGPA